MAQWRTFFYMEDCHKWIVGAEKGRRGYKHWQVRFSHTCDSVDTIRGKIQAMFEGAHVEECSDTWTYEAKEKWHWSSEDRPAVLKTRFGHPRWYQQEVINEVLKTNDREIAYWYDEKGCQGKSWLVNHLHETCQAWYVPPTLKTVEGIIQWTASLYINNGFREILVIDIPRSWKWSKELYTAIEAIKDGLVYDPRYHAQMVNIRGVKILVLCNTLPVLDALSKDRWCAVAPALS
nr:MAG: replication associated protein [ssDNA virus sp.]